MVKKAVIPAAGLGTRFLPATKAQPKEMLPIIDSPTIQYVVQEAVDSGITDILIITGKGKRAIEDHFDRNFELEARLQEKDEIEILHDIKRLSDMAQLHFVRQKELNGLGDAIMYAKYHVGDEPFAVLLGDTIVHAKIPATKQLIDVFSRFGRSVIGVEQVEPTKVSRYGIVGGKQVAPKILELSDLVEKPEIDKSPSNLAIAGRYVLTPGIFSVLEKTGRGIGNEIQLTDALRQLLEQENIYSCTLDGKRFDIGNKLDYLKTTVEFALDRSEFKDEFRKYLLDILSR